MECLKGLSLASFCFASLLMACLTRASVQCDLFADDGPLNTAKDNVENIRRDFNKVI